MEWPNAATRLIPVQETRRITVRKIVGVSITNWLFKFSLHFLFDVIWKYFELFVQNIHLNLRLLLPRYHISKPFFATIYSASTSMHRYRKSVEWDRVNWGMKGYFDCLEQSNVIIDYWLLITNESLLSINILWCRAKGEVIGHKRMTIRGFPYKITHEIS